MPEDTVPVCVEGDGSAATLYQGLHQQEVIVGVLLLAEEGVDHRTSGIVHRNQQRERRRLIPQPRVIAAVHLDQHALPGHALTAHPVFGRPPAPWTAQTGVDQDTPQGRPADFDALSFAQQLAQMGVVGLCILGARQMNHSSCNGLGRRVGRPAAAVAVSNGDSSLLTISRQDSPGMPFADAHQHSSLFQGHVLRH